MNTQRGWTLVSTMVTLVIMALLAVALFKGSGMFGVSKPTRKDGHGTTVLGASEWAAKDEVCRSNLSQVRSAIQILETSGDDNQHPQSIEETKLGKDFYSCPVGHEPYRYDPQTGQVHCVHPGHENY
jgi:hypothetical protein